MEITYKEPVHKVALHSLTIGETFYHNGSHYIFTTFPLSGNEIICYNFTKQITQRFALVLEVVPTEITAITFKDKQ